MKNILSLGRRLIIAVRHGDEATGSEDFVKAEWSKDAAAGAGSCDLYRKWPDEAARPAREIKQPKAEDGGISVWGKKVRLK